ncbi:hypothetical protein BDN71DRAFT_1442564 [Pleurotus eryngii]|uniref:Uncharacterized protein n=1 Tax=Pleurotus eryngii TaxID=5323 RepID=A0A9P6A4F1_PLEER|nr:hypothetical protein BDN71DRAFT_1442564 [Pleurotus eryngii]
MLSNFTITDLALPFLTCLAYVAIVRLRLWAEGPSDHNDGGPDNRIASEGNYDLAKVDESVPPSSTKHSDAKYGWGLWIS